MSSATSDSKDDPADSLDPVALRAELARHELRVSENASEVDRLGTFSRGTIDLSRLVMSIVVVLLFAAVAIFVVDQAELEYLRERAWPDLKSVSGDPEALLQLRQKLVDQDSAAMDNAMKPLNFLEDFLSSFVLPVVTLIIGFYFGKDVATKSEND